LAGKDKLISDLMVGWYCYLYYKFFLCFWCTTCLMLEGHVSKNLYIITQASLFSHNSSFFMIGLFINILLFVNL